MSIHLKDKYLIIILLHSYLSTKKRRGHFPAPRNNITYQIIFYAL